MPPGILRCATWLAALLALSGCDARPLSEAERAFAFTVVGDAVDLDRVTIVRGSASALIPTTIEPRPQLTCRQRLRPALSAPVPGYFPAFVDRDTMYFSRRIWQPDALAGYPDRMHLGHAMRLAHELTHVWQWQERAQTGYAPRRAFGEHVRLEDPYLVELDPELGFLDYGWEQQGVLVEEYVCCRALDPTAPRTAQLRALVRQIYPDAAAAEVVPAAGIVLPWPDAETSGICR